jgi:hypothetical protein
VFVDVKLLLGDEAGIPVFCLNPAIKEEDVFSATVFSHLYITRDHSSIRGEIEVSVLMSR